MDRKKYDADEAAVGKSMEVLSQGKTNVAVFLCVCVFWLVGWLVVICPPKADLFKTYCVWADYVHRYIW